MKIKLSKSQWEKIGQQTGWLKSASGWGHLSKDLSDVLEGVVLRNKGKKPKEIVNIIKADQSLVTWMEDENVTDQDLLALINDTIMVFGKKQVQLKTSGILGPDPKPCNCGSGEMREAVYDARHIFLDYVCPKCRKRKLSKFRPEVLTDPNYYADEPIEPEE